MLPVENIADIFYPMTAEVYYSSQTQGPLGNMVKQWQYDRTIVCSAIKERAEYNARYSVASEKMLEFHVKINMRTPVNLLIGTDGVLHRPTDILVTKIKDPNGTLVWSETSTEDTYFEMESLEPMFDENHVLAGYRALLARSDEQIL